MRQCAAEDRIRDINTAGLGKKFAAIVNEITLITGLKPPFVIKEDEKGREVEDMGPFVTLFSKFLLSHYSMITCAEVTLAFRLNASSDLPEKTDFYGSILTIEHVGRVLTQYIRKRANLAAKINDQMALPTPDKELPAEEREKEERDFANEYYRKYLSGEFSAVSLEYAYMVYDTLDQRGVINLTNKQKKEYMAEAQELRNKEISAPAVDFQKRKEQNRLIEAYLNDAIPKEEANIVKNYAKRLALMDQFKAWKEEQKTNIL